MINRKARYDILKTPSVKNRTTREVKKSITRAKTKQLAEKVKLLEEQYRKHDDSHKLFKTDMVPKHFQHKKILLLWKEHKKHLNTSFDALFTLEPLDDNPGEIIQHITMGRNSIKPNATKLQVLMK